MKKIIFQPYEWSPDGRDCLVDQALRRRFEVLEVEVSEPMKGPREDIYHLVDYGVTLKHCYSLQDVSITLYGSDEKVGEVERIVNDAIKEGLKKSGNR